SSWSASIDLEEGLNKVTAKVTSVAGNTKETSLIVFYLPIIKTQSQPNEQIATEDPEPTVDKEEVNQETHTTPVLAETTQETETKVATPSAENETQVLAEEKENTDYAKIIAISFVLGGLVAGWKLKTLSFLKQKFFPS